MGGDAPVVGQNEGDERRGMQVGDIVDALRRDIISGALAPDTWLRQERLASGFGVSRMPVREALRILESDGFVIIDPNRGARVAPIGADDLREICEMRIAAETLALRLALPELSNAQIDRAAAIQARIETASAAEFGDLNKAFHDALYAPCARPRLLSHIETLAGAADRYLKIIVVSLDYAGKSNREHHELLDACRARDEAAALGCLTRHIDEAGTALVERMRQGS